MNKKAFLPSHDWDEEVGNHTAITLAGDFQETSVFPAFVSVLES